MPFKTPNSSHRLEFYRVPRNPDSHLLKAKMNGLNKFVALAIAVGCILGSSRVVFGVARARSPSATDDLLMESDRKQMAELQNQIDKLQSNVAEIVRSFSTLHVIAKNPSLMSKIDNALANGDVRDTVKARNRRDVDSPLPLPQPTSPSPSRGDGAHAGSGYSAVNQFFGPYSYPMFSGQCFLCPAGVPGPRGPPGPAGIHGRDGRDGRDANIQPQVPHSGPGEPDTGATAATPAQPETICPTCNESQSGAIYVRWGKSTCKDGSELIYAGTAAGAHYTHTGSGSNYLCMPNNPVYDETDSVNGDRALLYSSEYQTSTSPIRTRSVHDNTPSCAVCRAPAGRTAKLLIPGRNLCPSDEWRLEYAGYLMAEKYSHKRSEFVCVDRALEAESGTHGDQNGALFYMVEARCLAGGGLPCEPYINGYELTCAVCTI